MAKAQDQKPLTVKKISGNLAEDRAVEILTGKGYSLVERNYRFGKHEIDIIAQDCQVLVFVEVKFRANNGLGYPEEMVTARQKSSVKKAAVYYLEQQNYTGHIRYDIVAITGTGAAESAEHFEDAF